MRPRFWSPLSVSSSSDPRRPTAATPPSRELARRLATAALALALLVPTALVAARVWDEWSMLMAEEDAASSSAVIGFRNVYPVISRAAPPQPWRRAEGDDLYIWGGWKKDAGHRWFKLAAGDCDLDALGDPIGRDVARAIDNPDVETGGGEIWARMPEAAEVAVLDLDGTASAYPRIVLGRVLVINDVVDGRPRLVHHDPFQGADGGTDIAVFDARVDGRRLLMGSGGFTMDHRHVLYDRETESLWVERPEGLTAFGGKLKGKVLPLIARPDTARWSDWRDDHPGTRLLVGALPPPRSLAAR